MNIPSTRYLCTYLKDAVKLGRVIKLNGSTEDEEYALYFPEKKVIYPVTNVLLRILIYCLKDKSNH